MMARGKLPVRKLVLAAAGLTLVIVAFFASYASALGNPGPRHIPVAVIAPSALTARLAATPLLSVHPVPDLPAGRSMIENRLAYGALDFRQTGPATLLVASGAGHGVATVLMELAQHEARARGTALATVDVAPTSPNDPNGTVEFYCIAFLGIGAAVGGTVLARILGPVRGRNDVLKRAGLVLLYAAVLSVVITFFADVVFGALVGHFGLLFLTLWLFVAAVCLAITGFASRAGLLASFVLIAVFILFGNPSSGGAVNRPLLPSFYAGLNPVLPQGAALSALRGVQYFGNRGAGLALLCLFIWAAAGLVLLGAAGLGRRRQQAVTAQ